MKQRLRVWGERVKDFLWPMGRSCMVCGCATRVQSLCPDCLQAFKDCQLSRRRCWIGGFPRPIRYSAPLSMAGWRRSWYGGRSLTRWRKPALCWGIIWAVALQAYRHYGHAGDMGAHAVEAAAGARHRPCAAIGEGGCAESWRALSCVVSADGPRSGGAAYVIPRRASRERQASLLSRTGCARSSRRTHSHHRRRSDDRLYRVRLCRSTPRHGSRNHHRCDRLQNANGGVRGAAEILGERPLL